MGLDYIISARIKNRKTKEVITIDIAYWRKCYSLRDVLQECARTKNPSSVKKIEDDSYTRCRCWVLHGVVEELSRRIADPDDYAWADSIWGRDSVRFSTCVELGKLCVAEAFFNPVNTSEDIIATASRAFDYDEDVLADIFLNPLKYKISIEFVNSY